MRTPLTVRSIALFVALAAGLVLAASSPAQDKKAKEAVKLSEAQALGQAYILLVSANHNYGGHCGKAQGEVLDAIKHLDGSVLKKGSPVQKAMAAQEERALKTAKEAGKSAPAIHESQELSNAQLRTAAVVLSQVLGSLEARKEKQSAERVAKAIKEIKEALAWQAKEAAKTNKKFVESEALMSVYVLLADANHDYDGHRAKAVHHVHTALKILDASIEKKGSPLEKAVTAANERMAKAAAQARNKEPKNIELQQASDQQLRVGRDVLHKVKESLAATRQTRPLEHVEKAIAELDIALKVR